MICYFSSVLKKKLALIALGALILVAIPSQTYAQEQVDLSSVKKMRDATFAQRVTPIVTVTGKPVNDITWEAIYIPESNWYEVTVDWPQTIGSDGYSVGLTKKEGEDPGNKITTPLSERHFKGVSPGEWYLNVKSVEDNKWSGVRSWKVELEDEVFVVDLEEDPESSASSVLGTSVRPTDALEFSTEEDSALTELRRKIEALMKKFGLSGLTGEPELETGLEGVEPVEPTRSGYQPVTRPSSASRQNESFTCDCSKKCKELSSCTEAYFQLFKCGCVNLDPNADNVPCGKYCAPQDE